MAKISHYGGEGFGAMPKTGNFEIKHDGLTYSHTDKEECIKQYEALEGEKFLWDLTRSPELIDGYVLEPDGDDDPDDLPFP